VSDRIEATRLAKNLGAALERVVAGETLEIERYGRVVAVLGPPERRPVKPDTVRPVIPGVTKAVEPEKQPKAETAIERQQRIDALLRGSRRNS
jgi:antitoxin (DNA-binding transcriptional repressor) of toxin-antitoxin stability system